MTGQKIYKNPLVYIMIYYEILITLYFFQIKLRTIYVVSNVSLWEET